MSEPTTAPVAPEPTPLDEIGAGWVEQWLDADRQVEEAEALRQHARDQLERLAGEGTVVLTHGGAVVARRSCYDKTTLDLARLKKERPEIIEAYSRTKPASSFTVIRP